MILLPRNDNSRVISPLWGLLPALLLVGVGAVLLWMAVQGIMGGEIWTLSKHGSGLVVRTQHPLRFWLWVCAYLAHIVIVTLLAARLMKGAWRGSQA